MNSFGKFTFSLEIKCALSITFMDNFDLFSFKTCSQEHCDANQMESEWQLAINSITGPSVEVV